jgi:membrane protease YdiL (CAAX protease family)
MPEQQIAMTKARDTGESRHEPARFWRQFGALYLLGLVGAVSLIPMFLAQLEAPAEQVAGMPAWAVVLTSLSESAINLAVAVAVGVLLARKVGLTSLVADRVRGGIRVWPRLRPDVPLAIGLGLAVAVAIVALDTVTAPLAGIDVADDPLSWFPRLVLGLLYGGIAEELLMRWGLMTALIWVGHRVFGRNRTRPSGAVVWTAILVTAVVFGLGHLPALAGYAELTPFLIARTVAVHAIGGIVFGWLYWRRSLEAAMVAHAFAHVGFAIARPVVEGLM